MNSLQFKYSKSLLALLLALSLIAPAGLTLAQECQLTPDGTCSINPDPTLNTGAFQETDSSPADEWQQEAVQKNRDAEEQLKQAREPDKELEECDPKPKGFGGGAGGLANMIGGQIQKGFSSMLGNIVSQNLQKIVQRQLGQVLPNLIERQLSQQLPGLLRSKMQSAGVDRPTGDMLQSAVRELLPRILQGGLPDALENGIRGEMRNQLVSGFRGQVPGALGMEFDEYGRCTQSVDAENSFQVNSQEWMCGNGTPEKVGIFTATQTQLDNFNSGVLGNSTPLNIFQGAQCQQVLSGVRGGVCNDIYENIQNDSGVDRMVQQIMPLIMKVVLGGISGSGNSGIMGQLNGITSGFGGGGGGGGGGFDFNAWAGNNITAAVGFDLAPLSQSLAQPLATSILAGVSPGTYDARLGNLAAVGYNGPITSNIISGAGPLSNISQGGALYLNSVNYQGPYTTDIVQAANLGDLSQAGIDAPLALDAIDPSTPGLAYAQDGSPIMNTVGSDAVGSIDSGNIAGNSTLGLGSNITAGLKDGLVNGLAGGIGNLVDGIPYFGELLSPIVDQVVQQGLGQVLGTGAGTPLAQSEAGWGRAQTTGAFPDPGTPGLADIGDAQVKATFFGFTSANKSLGKIDGQTKTSNKNEDTHTEQNANLQKTTQEQCQLVKVTTRVVIDTETLYRIDNPAARESALIGVAKQGEKFQEDSETAATPILGDGSGEGVSTIAEPVKDQADAAKAGILIAANQLSLTNDPEMQAVANTLTKLALVGKGPAPTMSLTERQNFQNATNIPADQYFPTRQSYWVTNNPMSLRLDGFIYSDELANHEEAAQAQKFLAYEGSRSKEQCVGQTVTVGGKEVCPDGKKTAVPGSTFTATRNAYTVAPVNAGINSHYYREDTALEPFFKTSNTWLTGRNNNQSGDNPLISDILSDGLNDALGNGLDRIFSDASMSADRFLGNLTSGWDSGNLTSSDLSNGGSFDFQTMVQNALQNTPGSNNLQPDQIPQIIRVIIQAIIANIQNQT